MCAYQCPSGYVCRESNETCHSLPNVKRSKPIDEVKLLKKLNIEGLHVCFDSVRKSVKEVLNKTICQDLDFQHCKNHEAPYRPTLRYYVVVARTKGPMTKMSANWVKLPSIVLIISSFTVEFEQLEHDSTYFSTFAVFSLTLTLSLA